MNKHIVYWVEVRQHNTTVTDTEVNNGLTKKEFVGEYKTHKEANDIIELAHKAENPRKGLYSIRSVNLNKYKSRKSENRL